MDGDLHLGRPTLVRAGAQPVADHLFEPADGSLGSGPGSLMAGSGSSPSLSFAGGGWWSRSGHGSLRGRRQPPHDGVGSVGLVMSAARSSRSWDRGRNRTPAMANTPSRHGTPFRPPGGSPVAPSRGHAGCASRADQRNPGPSRSMRCRTTAKHRRTGKPDGRTGTPHGASRDADGFAGNGARRTRRTLERSCRPSAHRRRGRTRGGRRASVPGQPPEPLAGPPTSLGSRNDAV
jgi:hypothetical protein